MATFVDSHVHLADAAFDPDREQVIERARLTGAGALICIGESIAAAGRARESLALYGSLGDDRSRARCLVVLACAAAADGANEDAARLVGAADALRAVDPVDDFERPLLDRYVPELEADLGAPRLDELRAEGASLAPEDVTAGLVTITTTD